MIKYQALVMFTFFLTMNIFLSSGTIVLNKLDDGSIQLAPLSPHKTDIEVFSIC